MLKQMVSGDTLATLVNLAAYPASEGWVLRYRLTHRAGLAPAIEFSAAAQAATHQVLVAAEVTAAWLPGDYAVAAWVQRSGERYTVAAECGQLAVLPNPATMAAGVDTRTMAVRTLEAIRAKLAGKASDGIQKYIVNGREVQSYSVAELIRLENFWATQVAIEERAAGLNNPRGQIRQIRVVMR